MMLLKVALKHYNITNKFILDVERENQTNIQPRMK